MPDPMWFNFLGILAALFGYQMFQRFRRNSRRSLGDFVLPAVGWYGMYHYFLEFWGYGDTFRWVALSFLFLGLSPLLGFIMNWEDGKIAKGIARVMVFLVVWFVGFFIAGLFIAHPITALISGIFPAILVSLPWKEWRRKRRITKRAKEYARAAAESEREEQLEQEHDDAVKEQKRKEFLKMVVKELKE